MKKFIISISYFFICLFYLKAQTLPSIQVYKPEDYNADNQNWQISQSSTKYIYVANNKGLLEFDGSKWHLYPSPNNTIIRSVKVIGNKIYTGCYMEFGYWMKNSLGKLEYTSLVPHLEEKMKEDEQIWHMLELNEWVVFQSSNKIYFYNTLNDTFKIITSDKIIYNIFKIRDIIYFNVRNEGIYKIENGNPKLVTDDPLIKYKRVINIFEVNDGLVFLVQDSGFYKFVNNRVSKWNITANEFLEKTTIYSGLQLSDGNFIVGTISNGIININADGSINYQINQRNGLSNNTALALFEDSRHDLWIGLDNGINCVNINSPIQVFNDYDGVLGTVYASEVFKNYLYIGTNQGLFYKKLNSKKPFKFIEGTGGQVWSLYNYKNEDLLCGHHLGTFIIDIDKASLIDNNLGSWTFKTIPNHENLLLKGNYDGLYVIEKTAGKWKVRNKIEGFSSSSRFFELDNKNNVWVGHEYKGVFKLHLNVSLTKAIKVGMEPSLTIGENSSLAKYRGDILYAFKKGIFKFDDADMSFKYDSLLSPIITNEDYVSGKLVVDKKGRLWGFSKENIYYVTNDNLTNKPKINPIEVPLNLRKVILSFENISLIRDNVYLVGTANGYLTIDLSKINHDNEYFVHLNSITLKDLVDNLINYDINKRGEFDYKRGIITFDYSVPSYNKFLDVKYQFRLKGLIDKWSEWSDDSRARFENLGFGNYVFEVRAKVGNKLSKNIISYGFEVHRPWFLTNIALLLYFLFLLLIAYITHKVYKRHYNKKLRNKQSESEKLIMQIKNEQLNQDIENKNRELTISKMSIIKKNELLNGIKKELKNLEQSKKKSAVIKLIDDNLNNTKDWEFFVKAFKNTDKAFLNKLKELHPNLTSNDVRFCVYLRLNLSSKEIADLLNITVKSVETKRYRLRKRMNLPHKENLIDYILSL